MADTPKIVPLVQPPPSSRLGGNPTITPAPVRRDPPVSHSVPVPTSRPAAGHTSSLPGPAREAPGGNKAS